MNVQRGDIFYVSNSKYYATNPSVEDGRPAVVVSSNNLNENGAVVEVVYLTSKPKQTSSTHVEIMCKVPSTAMCETIYTVSKDKLGDYIRTCTDDEMKVLNIGLLSSLGISSVPTAKAEPKETSADVERNLYKTLYEDLLNKVIAR